MRVVSITILALMFALPCAAGEPPIRLVFDVHTEPLPQVPMPQRLQRYFTELRDMYWLVDTMAVQSGTRLSWQSNGEFLEFLIERHDTLLIDHLLAGGHELGTHSHRSWHRGVHDWPELGNPVSFDSARLCCVDTKAMVDMLIADSLHRCLCAQVPDDPTGKDSLMREFGLSQQGGGPSEFMMGVYGHLPWHPYRPHRTEYQLEDPWQHDFTEMVHAPQIGGAGEHGPSGARNYFDLTVPGIQQEFLKCFLEHREHERLDMADKVWIFGWATHSGMSQLPQFRAAIEEFMAWLDSAFVGRVSPRGDTTATFASFSQVEDEFLSWEAANPGVYSIGYTPGGPYPWILHGVAEKLWLTHFVAFRDDWSSAGVVAMEFLASDTIPGDDTTRFVVYREFGDTTLDLSSLLGTPSAWLYDGETGDSALVAAAAVPVVERPSVIEPSNIVSAPSTPTMPHAITLSSRPNPSNPGTTLSFSLPEAGVVHLAVYDALGRKVAVLWEGIATAGDHDVSWTTEAVPSGLYIARLRCDGGSASAKVVVLK